MGSVGKMTTPMKSSNHLVERETEQEDAAASLMRLATRYGTEIPGAKLSRLQTDAAWDYYRRLTEPATEKQIGGFIDKLAIGLNKEAPPTDTLQVLIELIINNQVSLNTLREAYDRIIKTYKWSKFPSIADIWEPIEEEQAKVARLHWALVRAEDTMAKRTRSAPIARAAGAKKIANIIKTMNKQT